MQEEKKQPFRVKSGVAKEKTRFCFYGPESVGKTTLAAGAPNPIFVDIEDGSSNLNVDRAIFDNDGFESVVPESYDDIVSFIVMLTTSDHDYKTIVIDSMDRLQSLIWDFCIKRDSGSKNDLNKSGKKITSIESYGYGKGYNLAADELRYFLRLLDGLRKRKNMDVILIGHSYVRVFHSPESDSYDRYSIRCHATFTSTIKEWVDVLGFVTFEEGSERHGDEKAKGWSTNRRIMKLRRTAAYDAKSRIPLPSTITLPINPWPTFAAAVDRARNSTQDQILNMIRDEVTRIGDSELAKKVGKAVAVDLDVPTLNQYLAKLVDTETKNTEKEE